MIGLQPTPAEVLDAVHRIAVLGAHDDPSRPACTVPLYLARAGYSIAPVNPARPGATLAGVPFVGALAEVSPPAELILVFRRADQLPSHLDALRAAAPRCVWFQTGIHHAGVSAALREAGIAVVEDRCAMVEHARGQAR
jgi:predicted CoA-binding protein